MCIREYRTMFFNVTSEGLEALLLQKFQCFQAEDFLAVFGLVTSSTIPAKPDWMGPDNLGVNCFPSDNCERKINTEIT